MDSLYHYLNLWLVLTAVDEQTHTLSTDSAKAVPAAETH